MEELLNSIDMDQEAIEAEAACGIPDKWFGEFVTADSLRAELIGHGADPETLVKECKAIKEGHFQLVSLETFKLSEYARASIIRIVRERELGVI